MAKEVVKKEDDTELTQLEDECPDHDRHLCHIINIRNMKSAARLSKGAEYICFICGRAAKDSKNLCQPVKI